MVTENKTDPAVIVAEGYYRLKAENEKLREAIAALPDITPNDVSRNCIPTFTLIKRIQACRALLG